jgi:carbonic anhydrase
MQMANGDPLIRLRRKYKTELESLPDDDARSARVAELNVQQSIEVLRQHPAIKRAVGERGLTLHGLIYDIGAGELKILGEKGSKKANGLWTPN